MICYIDAYQSPKHVRQVLSRSSILEFNLLWQYRDYRLPTPLHHQCCQMLSVHGAQNLQSVNSTAAFFHYPSRALRSHGMFQPRFIQQMGCYCHRIFWPKQTHLPPQKKHWSIMKPQWQNGRNWISWSFLLIHSCDWIEKSKGCTTIKRQAVRFKCSGTWCYSGGQSTTPSHSCLWLSFKILFNEFFLGSLKKWFKSLGCKTPHMSWQISFYPLSFQRSSAVQQ